LFRNLCAEHRVKSFSLKYSAERRFLLDFIYMFEQELYNTPPTARSQEGDLFHHYEIKGWELGPRIYKILAISAVFNIAALGFIAQTDLLTRKGCDSPWAGRVCQVLDMAYVGTMLFGTERDFVDQEYEKIDLGDAEITFIDANLVSTPLDYPEGYFQIANPVQFEMLKQQQANGGFTSGFNPTLTTPETSNDLIAKIPELPKPNPDAVTGPLPDSPFSVTDTPKYSTRQKFNKGSKKPLPSANANTSDDQTAAQNNTNTNSNTTPVSTDPVAEVEINKRPMVDLGNAINELREKGPLNLESEFTITGKGKLDKTGKFDPKSFRFGPTKGTDEKVVNVVKESIEAVNEAGYLAYIKDIIGKELSFVFTQNAENLEATFQTDLDNESLAKARKQSLDLLISIVKSRKQGETASQNDKDDFALLEGVKTEVTGKTLRIKFLVPKGVAHPMIQRKLAEQAADVKKPNGNAVTLSNNNTASK
jgi:hypothetical protein